ncbi:hypothetical protein GN956_G13430 [Arapaima gigas]
MPLGSGGLHRAALVEGRGVATRRAPSPGGAVRPPSPENTPPDLRVSNCLNQKNLPGLAGAAAMADNTVFL